MSFYNVVKPCVVGQLHYVRPTAPTEPIEVDDDVAAPLVESGCLEPYEVPRISAEQRSSLIEAFFGEEPTKTVSVDGGDVVTLDDDEPPTIPPSPRKRGRRSEG